MVLILSDSYLEAIGWEQRGSRNRWELWTSGVRVAWMELDSYGDVARSCGVTMKKGRPVIFRRIDRVRGKR